MPAEPAVDPLFAPEELAQNERRKRAMMDLFISQEPVLIIGSGCSVRLKYPTWPGLLSKLADLARGVAADHDTTFLPIEPDPPQDLLRYAREIKGFINRCDGRLDKYYSFLSGEFGERDIDTFHRLLVKLPSRSILTTNYDPSLDLALMLTDYRLSISCIIAPVAYCNVTNDQRNATMNRNILEFAHGVRYSMATVFSGWCKSPLRNLVRARP